MLARTAAALAAAALALGACSRPTVSPHARVACVGCHRGPGIAGAATGTAAVPDESCAGSRCHPSGGPDSVVVRMVKIAHRNHPAPGGGIVACASCHTHGPDSLSLAAGATACALCHYQDITVASDSGCVECHDHPSHIRHTSQGVALPHAILQDAHVPCTRCHYRLMDGTTAVPAARCVTCHPANPPHLLPADSARLTAGAVDTAITADSAHAAHRQIACIACHEKVVHRVVAMSTSIELRCLSCHALLHRPRVPAADSAPDSTCSTCHANVHQDAQRLVLGLMPGDSARPSAMFMGGVTCQSCHIRGTGRPPEPGHPLRGTAASCTGCHGGAWGNILGMWQRGWARRDTAVSAYLRATRSALGTSAPAPALAKLREAEDLMNFLRHAGPLHNLPLSDRVMRRSVALAGEAYRAAGRPAPSAPELGPPVESGNCLACHYGVEEVKIRPTTDTGRVTTHGDHIFGGGLTCDACHAVGGPPPGMSGGAWMDSQPRP